MTSQSAKSPSLIAAPRIGFPVIIASLAINLLGLTLPLVVLQVFDRVIPFQALATLALLFIGLCIATVLDFLLKWARVVSMGHRGSNFELELGDRFLQKTLDAVPADYNRGSTGEHFERLNAVSQIRDYYSGQGRLLAIDLPFTAIFIVMIGLIGGWLVIVPIASLILLFLFKLVLQRAQGSIFQNRKTLDGRRYSFLIECLSQIVTVKADTMEPQLQRRYELLQKQSVDISEKLIRFSGFSQSFGALFSQAAVAAMGLFGGYLIIIGQIGMAELAACMLLNGRTVQPLLKMLSHWAQTENIAAAHAKMNEIAALEQRPKDYGFQTKISGKLTFKDVTLRRQDGAENVFSGVSFNLNSGETLSILGEAGAGKSSFLRLILAEHDPSDGIILLDDEPIRKFANTRGPGGIVYVDQKPAFFSGTILDNISGFGDAAAIERALDCSAKIGLEATVHRLPLGYATPMGQGGQITSSLALLQTISLVRALSFQPKVLLFNDASSAVDEKTVTKLSNCLAALKGQTTIVLATPRDQLLDLADQSIMLVSDTAESALIWDADAADDAATAETQKMWVA